MFARARELEMKPFFCISRKMGEMEIGFYFMVSRLCGSLIKVPRHLSRALTAQR